MGGGGDDDNGPTAQEQEQFKIATERWNKYRDNAPKLQEVYQSLATGYVPDGKGGLKIDKNSSVLNADGSVHTDSAQADAVVGRQWNKAQNRVNPNTGKGSFGNVALMKDRIASTAQKSTAVKLGQQNNYVRGVANVVAMGKGQQGTALKGMQDLTNKAAGDARNDTQQAYADRSANRYMFGQAAGAAGAWAADKYGNKSKVREG